MLRASASNSSREISLILEPAEAKLAAAGIETARLDAQLLLADAAHVDRAALLAGSIDLSPEIAVRFDAMLQRRIAHEPIAYIVGRREFYSLEFAVSRHVLIPRPHTETLVDAALAFIAKRPSARVLDIGTGPGSVAIAIAANAPGVEVVATDISESALAIAPRNAVSNGIASRVRFVRADLFEPCDSGSALGQFDIVVSNPPYIADAEVALLEADVRDFEPHLALKGGADGLDFFRRIATQIKSHLVPDGLLALEVGAGQDSAVAEILSRADMHPAGVIKDLDGIPRVVTAHR
jgi:release factor glutamine methyltransferase